ncbi:MAG: ferrochelatase [Pseudomonadota bacterium]
MIRYIGHKGAVKPSSDKIAVLLVNLGTPDAPTAPAVRRYLSQFLSDQRVVEIPKILWYWVLHGIILRLRPRKVAEAYASVWTEDGSPLLAISRNIGARLQERLDQQLGSDVAQVMVAMRYGNPSITSAIAEVHEKGIDKVLLVPMYPQYCASTTATVFDEVARQMRRYRHIPELRVITQYHRHPLYIEALANSVREARANDGAGEKLLFSYHGIPQRCVKGGDPYYDQCVATTDLLVQSLQLSKDEYELVFQSRFGPEAWLQPYCVERLESLGEQKLESLDIMCPGFSADCLETLEEIDVENREVFTEAGGGTYRYIPALNESDGHIDLYAALVKQHTQGWT